jgi:class 3 adenylate cyclase/tetratricopeptide (TPR) repeat protein
MQCPACQGETPADARFCMHCAAPLARACASCGAELPLSSSFCPQCAHRVEASPPAPPVPLPRDPRDYTPRHLADKILQSKSALEGERKQVTVLFADVKGSMELAEQVDPEEWHRMLDRFFQILADGVHRFEGTVNQYTGDGIMALFGAPIAHEDHAQRACYAALHLRDELRRYADELRRTKALSFSVRIGLNSGEVIVGKIGDDLRMDYTAQGHTVGLAQRMEQLAPPESTYLTDQTARLVEGLFRLRDLGGFDLKGTGQPVRAFELQDVGALRTRLEVSRARGFSKFVGREGDMQALEAALARSRETSGQVVGVVAEAGVGKSRLCYEFIEGCRARGLTIFEGRAVSHGRNIPFLPMLQVFRAYYGITERDDDRAVREKIAGRLLLIDEGFREVLPLLFEFFGVPDPAQPAPRMDPEASQRQLFAVLRRLVREAGGAEPPVTLIEDLHWMDGGSLGFLEQWVEAIGGTRGLLLLNFRPEYHAEWMGKSYYQQLPLGPLAVEATSELVADLLGCDPSTEGLAEAIHGRTAGNPFFTEEVVQSLIESGQLEGVRGSYRLVSELGALEVPATVQAVVAARIDRLAEREKQVLQAASVIGREFAEPVLEAVAELGGADLAESLRALTGGEFLYEQSLYPVAEYAFKHPLTQEVAYGSQLGERRARVHASVARAIAELDAGKLDERSALLAHHWEQAGEDFEAARWHARAAGWVASSDPEAGRSHWLQVRRLLAPLEDSAEKLGLDLLACGQLTQLGWSLGAPSDEIEALFAEGKALAERIPDPGPRSLLHIAYASYVGFSGGDTRRYVSVAREAVPLAEASGDPVYRLAARTSLAYVLSYAGSPTESLELLERCVADRPEDPLAGREIMGFSPWIFAVMIRFFPLDLLGRLGEADEALRRGIELAREHGEFGLLGWGLGLRVFHGELRGETTTALASARQGVEVAERTGVPVSLSLALAHLGDALRLEQRYPEALEAYQKALDLTRTKRVALGQKPLTVSGQALVYSALGEHEQAIAQARSALEESVWGGNRGAEDIARLALARVLLATGDPGLHDDVETTVERAEALCAETGMRVHLPPLLEVRAALAERRGNPQEVRRKLREAHRLYTEMGATGHASGSRGNSGCESPRNRRARSRVPTA